MAISFRTLYWAKDKERQKEDFALKQGEPTKKKKKKAVHQKTRKQKPPCY